MTKLITGSLKKIGSLFVIVLFVISFQRSVLGQSKIPYADKNIFLSGINAAWVSFAADLGPNPPGLDQFRKEFQTVRDNGGNAMRLWLYTNGSQAPEYNSSGYVTGPGSVAIKNLKQILELAHHYNVGLILCLWSFDMLRKTELDSLHLYGNLKMLTDTSYTGAFIRNALVPMVDSVKGDSAVLAWEVCNEPNGMTTGMNYYSGDPTVSPSTVRRFTNLIAGAIHRTDNNALVTTGPGSFQTLTDVNPISKISAVQNVNSMSAAKLQTITDGFNAVHRYKLTSRQMKDYLEKIAVIPDSNYYRDDRLIAAGGDSLGILDFYCVHYYSSGSTVLSPFTHQFSYWQLTKPTVIAEFYMTTTDGVPALNLFQTLYGNGYAGALAWSWTDFPNTPNNPTNAASNTWTTLQIMKANYKQDVDPFNTDFPTISIISPKNNSTFADSTQIMVTVAVKDTGSSIDYVEFFSADSSLGKIFTPSNTVSDTLFYSFVWKNIKSGYYVLSAIAENNLGQQEISSLLPITFGTVQVTKFEAEKAAIHGTGITVKSDPTASGGAYDDIQTNDSTATITWTFVNGASAGTYPISFGYKLNYASPKSQFINVNGVRTDTLVLSGSTTSWQVQSINVNLAEGTNIVQLQVWWGWMSLDYLAVPSSIVTSVENSDNMPMAFSLSQNYPNPFNPSTTIDYMISKESLVTLKIYDVLGQVVKTLVNQEQRPGSYIVNFNAGGLASGIYFYTLRAGNNIETKKMILLK